MRLLYSLLMLVARLEDGGRRTEEKGEGTDDKGQGWLANGDE